VSIVIVFTPNNRNCNPITLKFIFLAWYRRYFLVALKHKWKIVLSKQWVYYFVSRHTCKGTYNGLVQCHDAMTNGIVTPTPLCQRTPLLCQLAETIVSSLYKWLVPENAQNSIQWSRPQTEMGILQVGVETDRSNGELQLLILNRMVASSGLRIWKYLLSVC
jgi:hypothetical protein